MRRAVTLAGALLLVTHSFAEQGTATGGFARGKVVSVSTERLVIEKEQGTLLPLEVGRQQVGPDKWVPNPQQIRFLRMLRKGDVAAASWTRDERGQCSIRRVMAGMVRGVVVMVGETRIAIEPETGGQMALEMRSEEVAREKLGDVQKGDRIAAAWTLGDGQHYHLQQITRSEGGTASEAEQLRALQTEVAALRDEIQQLRGLVDKVLERRRE